MQTRALLFRLLIGAAAVLGGVSIGLGLWTLWLPAPKLDVVILTVESTRADAISPETTPNIWRLAKRGARFTEHRGTSAWTAAGAVSILTGLSAFEHGIHTRDETVPERWQLPLEDLAAKGWTAGGLQSFMQIPNFAHLGMKVDAGIDPRAWIEARLKAKEPYLLWYHYLPTHLPYNPSPAFRPDWKALLPPGDSDAVGRIEKVMSAPVIPAGSVAFQPSDLPAIKALYLGGIREFDAWFADFWSFLDAKGRLDKTVIVLTTDHGEEHLERGQVGHASTTRSGHLHEELVELPLIIWAPKGSGFDRRVVDRLTDHTDIMPTVMRLLGVTPTRALSGHDLAQPLPERRAWNGVTSEAGFAEADPKHIRRFIFARLEWPWKLHLIQDDGAITKRELFNLDADPEERTDVSGAEPATARRLEAALAPLIQGMRHYKPGDDAAKVAALAPAWARPAKSGTFAYDDLQGRFRLEWTGEADAAYRLQYKAGEGLLAVAGEMEVVGTAKDFGTIDRGYWDTWLVPYGTFRLRVGVAGRDDLWSDWLTLKAVK